MKIFLIFTLQAWLFYITQPTVCRRACGPVWRMYEQPSTEGGSSGQRASRKQIDKLVFYKALFIPPKLLKHF